MNRMRFFVTVCAGSIGLWVPASAAVTTVPGATPVASANERITDGLAPAQETAATPSSEEWRFKLQPYMWFAGIDGDVTADNVSADVDVSFSDIWDNLDFAAMLSGEARKGNEKWALGIDTLYMDIEDDGASVDVTLDAFMAEFDFIYQLGPEWLEVLAGARYWYFKAETSGVGPGAEKSKDWVDPIIGARATCHPFNERWTARLRIDGGGFDVGSKGTYQVVGFLDYAFSESFSVAGGYRQLAFEYEGDRAEYDLRFSGPALGLTWSF